MAVGSFLKKGKAAKKAFKQEEERIEAARSAAGGVRRLWIKPEGEVKLTFLDGDLDDDGMLDVPVVYEHQCYMNGNWRNWFVCVGDKEPCPICEGGDRPYLAGLLTVIDHTEFTDRQNNVRRDEVRLYVAKRSTMKQLQKYAVKRKGLAGCTFDISRMANDAPSVGDMFDFVEKTPVDKIKKQYGVDVLDYEDVLTVKSAKELRQMGFGTGAPIGEEEDDDEEGGVVDEGTLDEQLG